MVIGPIPIAVPCVVAPLFPTWAQSAHEEAFVLVDPGGKVDSTNVLIDVAKGLGSPSRELEFTCVVPNAQWERTIKTNKDKKKICLRTILQDGYPPGN